MPLDPLEAPKGYRAAPEIGTSPGPFPVNCVGCAFRINNYCRRSDFIGFYTANDVSCSKNRRQDECDVIFVKDSNQRNMRKL